MQTRGILVHNGVGVFCVIIRFAQSETVGGCRLGGAGGIDLAESAVLLLYIAFAQYILDVIFAVFIDDTPVL